MTNPGEEQAGEGVGSKRGSESFDEVIEEFLREGIPGECSPGEGKGAALTEKLVQCFRED